MIITVCGDNNFRISEFVSKEKKNYIDKYGDMSVEQVDCEEADLGRIVSALGSLPFLAPEKLIILRHPSKNKLFTEEFNSLIGTIPDTVKVLVVEGKLDKRSSFYKGLKTKTDFKELQELKPFDLLNWLKDYASDKGAKISSEDAKYLIERVGENQNKLAKEIDKLATYDKNISKDTIDNLSVKSIKSSIFDLIKSAIMGDTETALKLYQDQKQLNVEPQKIVSMLAWQLSVLALIKSSGGIPTNEIASKAKVNPYSLSQSQVLAQKLSFGEIKEMINELFELDISIKTKTIDVDQALQGYILSLQR